MMVNKEFVDRYTRLVRTRIREIMPRILPCDLDDCTQEVWLQVCKSEESFEGRAKVSTWIGGIAKNVARDKVRYDTAQKRPQLTFECELESQVDEEGNEVAYYDRYEQDIDDPASLLEARETAFMVEECAAALSPMMQLVYVLHWQEGLDAYDLGVHLGTTTETARRYITRVKDGLRQ